MANRRGFTLMEVLISLAVFTILITVSGAWMVKLTRDWKMQREYFTVTEEADWLVTLMTQEIKKARATTYSINATDNSLFLQIGPSEFVVYRKQGTTLVRRSGTVPLESWWTDEQNLSRCVANNDIFLPSTDAACVNITLVNLALANPGICINLIMRPDPSRPATVSGNKNYTIQTMVNFKN